MTQVHTQNAQVEASFAALKSVLRPIIERKHAIIRTCGSEPVVTVNMDDGTFNRRLSSKPPRWIVRVQGRLDRPDELAVNVENVIGQYNLTQPVDIVVARVLFLYREHHEQPWEGFDHYECRLVVMMEPALPVGSSSVPVRVCLEETPADESNRHDYDDDAGAEKRDAPDRDVLAPRLTITRRNAPAQSVSVHGAMLICPPPEDSEASIGCDIRVALEDALVRALEPWLLHVLRHADDTTTQIAFAKVFDALEPLALIDQVRTRYAPPPARDIDEAVYRRFSLALHAGFCRFVVVARDWHAGCRVVDAMQKALKEDTCQGREVPVFTACREVAPLDDRIALRKGVAENPAWILLARDHHQAGASLEGCGQEASVCTLVVLNRVTGRDLLQQAYRNAGMTPPRETDDLGRHLLFLTWQSLNQVVPDYTVAKQVDAFVQLCLRLAPAAAWQVPVDDPTRTVWEDATALLFPIMLSGVSQARKDKLARHLVEAAEMPESSERALLQVL